MHEGALEHFKPGDRIRIRSGNINGATGTIANPWIEFAGRSANDADFDEYQAEIAQFRQSVDSA